MKKTICIIWIFLFTQTVFAVDTGSRNIENKAKRTTINKKEIKLEPKQKSISNFRNGFFKKRKVLKKIRRFIKSKIKYGKNPFFLVAAVIMMIFGVIIWFIASFPLWLVITLFIVSFLSVALLLIWYLWSDFNMGKLKQNFKTVICENKSQTDIYISYN